MQGCVAGPSEIAELRALTQFSFDCFDDEMRRNLTTELLDVAGMPKTKKN